MADVTTTQLVCPHCKSTNIKKEERLISPNSVNSIGYWRVRWGYWVAVVVIAFGLFAIFARRYVDPTLSALFLAIGGVSFVYALYVMAVSLTARRWTRTQELVCQNCLFKWGTEESAPE